MPDHFLRQKATDLSKQKIYRIERDHAAAVGKS